MEMYVLDAYGKDRKQIQIINQYDACCFVGIKWKIYYSEISVRVIGSGNSEWGEWLDVTHKEHKI